MNQNVTCPVCDAVFEVAENVELNELLTCPDCGSELEVVNLKPLEVAEAPQEEEDWGE
ncbi:MAG: lysine biosynthesis protein LysW [Calditrichaeota bacterium]|nr:lysine biosynthesis protein LysW [Calditrichota bacterium]